MNKEIIEELRDKLNKLVSVKNICLHEGEVLKTSQRLDEVLNNYKSAQLKV